MTTHPLRLSRTRWRLVLALVAIGVVVTVAVLRPWESSPGGSATVEEAVGAYIDALNRKDADVLRGLSGTDPAVDAGIQRRLAQYGGRNIRLTGQQIEEGTVVPHHGSARLTGTMTTEAGQEQPYQELLRMKRFENRWFIGLQDNPPRPTGPFPLPTLDVGQPG